MIAKVTVWSSGVSLCSVVCTIVLESMKHSTSENVWQLGRQVKYETRTEGWDRDRWHNTMPARWWESIAMIAEVPTSASGRVLHHWSQGVSRYLQKCSLVLCKKRVLNVTLSLQHKNNDANAFCNKISVFQVDFPSPQILFFPISGSV